MGKIIKGLLVLCLLSASAIAQDLITVTDGVSIQTKQTITTNKINENGKLIATIPTGGEISGPFEVPLKIASINTDAAIVNVRIEDQQHNDKAHCFLMIDKTHYASSIPGTYWFSVNALDFDKHINPIGSVIIQIGPTPAPTPDPTPPGPTPTPTPPTPPNPPAPDSVPNDYHVGLLAYTLAPEDQTNIKMFSETYQQAAGFITGFPTYKFVQSIKDNDTEKNVIVWIRNRLKERICTDKAKCEQWNEWYQKINIALLNEQKARGAFTVADWTNVFLEIASGLEARRK